ncbi:hypothetical protein FKR81_24260 [Lentzea tibetensis]|uniref:Uncharacterized protein n=1 Tax=Lentzea tibetensis TaxID=2591470 RepID=A0A563EPG3_9PSEU|nr:hypothetical protein [Lentzea tibetensis]TWP49235.1 hypothetical protein FKR81_24260 [Lentzea tibetensis]
MAEAITDRHVVAVLRPFVRASGPLVDRLRESNPFGLRDSELEGLLGKLATIKAPGTAAWAAMSVEDRDEWWINRVGRFTALLASVPGIGGALADRLPIQDALGAAGQGLLLCALAGEHGFTSVEDRVRLLAWVLFERDVDPTPREPDEDARTEELKVEGGTMKAVARTVWKLGRMLWGLGDELGKRPQGRLHHKALGMLPVVGLVGDYLGERSALRKVRTRALQWFDGIQ